MPRRFVDKFDQYGNLMSHQRIRHIPCRTPLPIEANITNLIARLNLWLNLSFEQNIDGIGATHRGDVDTDERIGIPGSVHIRVIPPLLTMAVEFKYPFASSTTY